MSFTTLCSRSGMLCVYCLAIFISIDVNCIFADQFSDLVLLAKQREEILRSYEVDLEFQGGEYSNNVLTSKVQTVSIVSHLGNLRVNWHHVASSGHATSSLGAKFDGRVTVLESLDGVPKRAVIANEPLFLNTVLDLNILLGAVGKRSMSDWLISKSVATNIDNDGLAVFTGEIIDDGSESLSQLIVYLDPKKNGSFVRRLNKVKYRSSDIWLISAEVRILKNYFDEISGFYFPAEGEYLLNATTAESSGATPLLEQNVKLINWRFPANLDANTFQVDIPNGVVVDDTITGRTYISNRVTSADIETAVIKAKAVKNTTTIYPFIIFGMLLGTFILIVIYRRNLN